MKFNTHNRTPKPKTPKYIKVLLAVAFGLIYATFIFAAIVTSFYISSIMPAVMLLTLVLVLTLLIVIPQKDIDKAYVEINDDKITVVDYWFGIKKEKVFLTKDIVYAEEVMGGYCCGGISGCTYIVFRDNRDKYLFKIFCAPETKQFFEKYLNQR